jgi:outer membrane protein assembly factor BamB
VTVEGDAAFVADEGGSVFAVGLADGEVRWTADAGAKVEVAVAVADGLVVVARDTGDRGVIVSAFDRETGSAAGVSRRRSGPRPCPARRWATGASSSGLRTASRAP